MLHNISPAHPVPLRGNLTIGLCEHLVNHLVGGASSQHEEELLDLIGDVEGADFCVVGSEEDRGDERGEFARNDRHSAPGILALLELAQQLLGLLGRAGEGGGEFMEGVPAGPPAAVLDRAEVGQGNRRLLFGLLEGPSPCFSELSQAVPEGVFHDQLWFVLGRDFDSHQYA